MIKSRAAIGNRSLVAAILAAGAVAQDATLGPNFGLSAARVRPDNPEAQARAAARRARRQARRLREKR